MFCPSCGSPILATDARCINCRKLLIESSEKKSDAFKEGAKFVDQRVYYGVGAFIGILVAFVFFYSDDEILIKACPIGAAIGGLIGKHLANQRWK